MPSPVEEKASTRKRSEWLWLAQKLRPSWILQMLCVLGLCGTGLLWLVDPLILKWLIDIALPSRQLGRLGIAVVLLLVVFSGRFVLLIASLYASAVTSQRLIFALRSNLFARLQRCSSEFFETHATGALAYLLEQDVDQVGSLGADVIPTLVRILLTALLTIGMMFHLNWSLTLSVVGFFPVFLTLGFFFRRILERAGQQARTASTNRNSLLIESLTAAIQIQLLGALLPIRRRYVHGVAGALRASLAERKWQLVYSAASLCTIACATTVMLGFGGVGVIHGSLSIGGYVAFYSYLVRLFDPLNAAIDLHSRLQKGRVSARKLMDLEMLEPDSMAVGRAAGCADVPTRGASTPPIQVQRVTFDNVSFNYSEDRPVLQDVSLSLRAGERLAVTGLSGSGKSTLVKLLTRLYDHTGGSILINDVDVRNVHAEDLRRIIGVVPQEPILFQGTVRENLLIGNRNATDREIFQAIECACLDEVIAQLPGGLDYKLGQFGAGLSGGEKQRLALARVLIQNRPILVLDEATTALDSDTKAPLFARLSVFAAEKLVLVISHDKATRAWASRRILICDGRSTELNSEPLALKASDVSVSAEMSAI